MCYYIDVLNVYEVLEIEKVLRDVTLYSYSDRTTEALLSAKMLKSSKDISDENNYLKEAIALMSNRPIKTFYSSNVEKIVQRALKDDVLSIDEIEKINNDIGVAHLIFDYFANVSDNLSLKNIVINLNNLDQLSRAINAIISPKSEIMDSASPLLAKLRSEIKKAEYALREKAQNCLTKYVNLLAESVVSLRDGRFVLSIKTSNKNAIDGIVHDVSDSGLTTFIEPSELVLAQNDLSILKIKENEEIIRILRNLTQQIAKHGTAIIDNNLLIGRIDLLLTKARYALEKHYISGQLNDSGIIDIKGGYHPLIDPTKVIKNDFYFDRKQKIIILSGPNAGGKSVALKTLGIIALMHQMGLPLPVDGSISLPYFPRIFVDIGDNQSISDNFSTFSAHVDALARITKYAAENDLVILDELGSSTSPKEGSALAVAIIDYLVTKNCFAFISSHFDELKEYAYIHDGIINAMMIFDNKNYLPTYKLKIGLPGKSYGLYIAKKYHLNAQIIDKAKEILATDDRKDVSDIMESLVNETNQLASKNAELDTLIANNKRLEQQLTNEKDNILAIKDDIKQHSEEIISDLVQKAKENIDNLLGETRQISLPKAAKIKNELDSLIAHDASSSSKNGEDDEIKLNDYVKIVSLNIIGKVVRLSKKSATILTNDGFTIQSKIDDLVPSKCEPLANARFNTSHHYDDKVRPDIKNELIIIGLRYDEAMEKVKKFLDDALLRNFKQVRIVHGFGSGALRRGVWEILKNCEFIASYRYAERYDGGEGATIAYFK